MEEESNRFEPVAETEQDSSDAAAPATPTEETASAQTVTESQPIPEMAFDKEPTPQPTPQPVAPQQPQMPPPMSGAAPQRPPIPPQMGRPYPGAMAQPPIPPQGQIPPYRGNVPPYGAMGQPPHNWNPQQPGGGNWYQNNPQPPRYNGWQVPPQAPPMPPVVPPERTPEQKDKRTAFWLKVVAALLAALLVYCIGSDVVMYRTGNTAVSTSHSQSGSDSGKKVVIQQQSKPEGNTDAAGMGADGAYTVEGVAAAVRPSIVEIDSYGDANATLLAGTGSGIILSEDGYIITNAHVLTDGIAFRVITADEQEYTATVIGSDAKTDLAVIHIDAEDLPAATMGDSDEAVLGESVVAIGNPAGLSGSVTNGIVSGLNRQIRSDSTGFPMDCIQTNAAISPGNSGGALVNMYGQVIGITSSKYVSSSYEGLGFAITINEVLPIVEDLITNGYVSDRVRIGITFVSLESEQVQTAFAAELGLEEVPADLTGVWVTAVSEDCDISNTQLQPGDVILVVQGEAVSNYDALCAAIADLKAGDEMEARCRRYQTDGTFEEFTIRCKLMADTSGDY